MQPGFSNKQIAREKKWEGNRSAKRGLKDSSVTLRKHYQCDSHKRWEATYNIYETIGNVDTN